ncbi:outer membrane beta-barrel protein [Rickettsiaceae bacterium]|nr:outer membrane beta-barrel protein [Rickettsiaceae bacterium]
MKKILLTAAAATVLATSSAYALEDMFYVKINGAYCKTDKVKIDGMSLKSGNAFFAGIGAGYYAMDNLRVDLTLDRFFNPEHKSGDSKVKGDINTAMFGLFVDVADVSVAKFFLGASAGGSQLKAKFTKGDKSYTAKQKYNLAWAIHLGASTKFVQNVTGELSYSYRDMGKTTKFTDINETVHYKGHHVAFGVRFDI